MYDVMHARSHADYVDTITVTQEIDGEKVTQQYVTRDAFDELAEAYASLKRALAVAHSTLVHPRTSDARKEARKIIEDTTGLTELDAQAMRDLISSFRRNS